MHARKLRQRDLFDDEPPAPALPREAREEALQVLTQWLRTLSQTMVQGSGDEQDRR